MDETQFDRFTRGLGTRRTTLGVLLGVVAGLTGLGADANKKKRDGRRASAKQGRNEVDVERKKKKKKKKCKGGTIKCGNACINAQTDAQNCGGCGVRCGNGVACVAGRCSSSCPPSQIRCGDLCVDPASNEQHCGGCGQGCTGDLTCLNGQCGCADGGDAQCGDECVNLQTDDDHCGACGAACPAGRGCSAGQCEEDDGFACTSQADCGGNASSLNDLVCQNNRCVCDTIGEGLCRRFSDGSGWCDVCCPGGSGLCPNDFVCRTDFVSKPTCDCPRESERCNYSGYGVCSEDQATDSRRCGLDCLNCKDIDRAAFCLGGRCAIPCERNNPCTLQFCTGGQTCGEGKACCKGAPGEQGACFLLENGRCPGPPP